jgi:hypothetical protein
MGMAWLPSDQVWTVRQQLQKLLHILTLLTWCHLQMHRLHWPIKLLAQDAVACQPAEHRLTTSLLQTVAEAWDLTVQIPFTTRIQCEFNVARYV